MQKFTRHHARVLREYMDKMDSNGCLPVSEWTSGNFSRITNRALPPFVHRIERNACSLSSQHGTIERTAYNWFCKPSNSRRRAVLVLNRDALWAFLTINSLGAEFDD